MANPQKENGYVAVANEIYDAFAKIRIPGEARQILDVIIRKTYGFNKKVDAISLSQFELLTGLKRARVCRGIKKLLKMKLISSPNKGTGITKYQLNKDFDEWMPVPKKRPQSPKRYGGSPQSDNKVVPKVRHTKDTLTITNITKDIGEAPKEINLLLDFFKKTVNPHIGFNNKTERKACSDLLKAYGLEKIKQSMAFLEEKRKTDRYLPIITTPYELWTKWAKIKQHLESKQGERKGIRI